MKKIILLLVVMITIFAVFVGCENNQNPINSMQSTEPSTLSKNVENQSQQSSQGDDKLEFIEFEGKTAIITEDTHLKNLYTITTDLEGNNIYQDLSKLEEITLYKNDIVMVIQENNEMCRIIQVVGDVPRLRGTIEKSKLNYDSLSFPENANHANVQEAMGYDSIDGNEEGIKSFSGTIKERNGDWVKITAPGGAGDLWFKAKDLSYDFDTSIIDYVD